MALSKGAKVGIGLAVVGGGLLLFGGAASAKPTVVFPVFPVEPIVDPVQPPVQPPPIVDPVPPPPKPNAKKNFVGSGWNWPRRERFPNVASFVVFLNTYGYAATVAQNIVSDQNRAAIRKFQQDFNLVRAHRAKQGPVALGAIATDGLIGVGTINAMLQAEAWVNQFASPWQGIVSQVKAANAQA